LVDCNIVVTERCITAQTLLQLLVWDSRGRLPPVVAAMLSAADRQAKLALEGWFVVWVAVPRW